MSEQAPSSHPQLFHSRSLQLPYRLGDYLLQHKLGEGGMGLVFEAEHLPSKRRVALKVLKNPLENQEQTQRFLREGKLAATIEHPRSIYVFGTEEIDGLPVIAMELASGGTLADEVRRRGSLPLKEAVDAILDVLDGLEAAYSRGVLHRDMKPSNCFLSSEGRVWVGDYGLSISQNAGAEAGEPLTRTGLFMGTPAFVAPEQIRGEALDCRADLYSTGATLFYLLTGRPPVQGGTPMEVIASVLEGRLLDLRVLRPDLPAEFASVLKRCLAREPAHRFQNYDALKRALVPFSSATPALAAPSMRFGAYLIDNALLVDLLIPALGLLGINFGEDLTGVLEAFLFILFFSVAESVWGTTPGKCLLGIRVAGLEGHRPHWIRILLRALLLFAPQPILLNLTGVPMPTFDSSSSDPAALFTALKCVLGTILAGLPSKLLLANVLWRPQRIAWLDRITKTRVLLKATPSQRRSELSSLPESAPQDSSGEPLWGPYQPDLPLSETQRFGWDPVLRRRVQLQLRSETGEPSPARKVCSRPNRLRWLQSVFDPQGRAWEAWQSPAGNPWSEAIQLQAPNWSQTLGWMQDITLEFQEAQADGTLPRALTPGHLWVTSDGQILLLDQPWRECAESAENSATAAEGSSEGAGLAPLQRLLLHLAKACPSTDRPLHADALLKSLLSARFESLTCLAGTLAHLKSQRTRVYWPARVAIFALSAVYIVDQALQVTMGDGYGTNQVPMIPVMLGKLAMLGVLTSLFQGLSILTLGSPFLLRFSGLCLVSETERPASRGRLLWRWTMGWGFALLMTLILGRFAGGLHLGITDGLITLGVHNPDRWRVTALGVVLLTILSAVVVNILRPGRSYIDKLAGTWLVPR